MHLGPVADLIAVNPASKSVLTIVSTSVFILVHTIVFKMLSKSVSTRVGASVSGPLPTNLSSVQPNPGNRQAKLTLIGLHHIYKTIYHFVSKIPKNCKLPPKPKQSRKQSYLQPTNLHNPLWLPARSCMSASKAIN